MGSEPNRTEREDIPMFLAGSGDFAMCLPRECEGVGSGIKFGGKATRTRR